MWCKIYCIQRLVLQYQNHWTKVHICIYKKTGSPHRSGRRVRCLEQAGLLPWQAGHRQTVHALQPPDYTRHWPTLALTVFSQNDKLIWQIREWASATGWVRIRKKLQREEEGGFPQVVLNDNLNEVRALIEQILGTRQMWEDIYLRKQKGCQNWLSWKNKRN